MTMYKLFSFLSFYYEAVLEAMIMNFHVKIEFSAIVSAISLENNISNSMRFEQNYKLRNHFFYILKVKIDKKCLSVIISSCNFGKSAIFYLYKYFSQEEVKFLYSS